MAKLKVSTETEVEQITTPANEQNAMPDLPTLETSAKKTKTSPGIEDVKPNEYTLSILRTFSSYCSLYVDNQGGIYTYDTPERIRGNAILYKNPYYKS